MNTNKKIRQVSRKKRSALSLAQQRSAEFALNIQSQRVIKLLSAKKIASYLPANGEISPNLIQKRLIHANFFLPRISSIHNSTMQFYPSSNKLVKNKFKLLEPLAQGSPIRLQHLDVVLMPLVAFDRRGNRLGMGGGFYDRAFEFCKPGGTTNRPKLIGIAHAFQEIDSITPQYWDVPLDAIITDKEFINLSL